LVAGVAAFAASRRPLFNGPVASRSSSVNDAFRAALLLGQFEPSFGDLALFGLFFFASGLFRGSQSFLAKATILFSLADHAIAAEIFRKNRLVAKVLRSWSVANWT
jgi:hypothetical protein